MHPLLMPVPVENRAVQDPLTGLPARADLARRLQRALVEDDGVAVLIVDVDRFKDINDTLGHAAGDRLLQRVVARLMDVVGPEDTLARFAADEFVVLCRAVRGELGVIAVAERLLDAFRAPLAHDDREVFLTASVGAVVGNGSYHDAEAMLRDADLALHAAKEAGGARYVLFDSAMRRRVVERVRLEHDLRGALERDELFLEYQPLVALGDRRIGSVEALLRWEHPRLGLVSPSVFVPIAEERGLIVEFGRWVLTEACRQLARWLADPTLDVPDVSINISGRQLADPHLPDMVAEVLRRTGVPPERVVLELTETVLIGETTSPTAVLQRLKALGVRLVLDDFGTGYSSLNYLKLLPIDGLKVDRSFIAGITDGEEDRHILRAIVQLADALSLPVTAEGVETLEQAGWVRSLGCRHIQGYLFAAPGPAPALETLLRQGLPREWEAALMAADTPQTPAAAVASERAADEQTVPLGEAAEALGVSTSTLRRWSDSGRIRAIRTSGGHRRFPVGEIQRLRAASSLFSPPIVRLTPLPEGPLSAVARLLAEDGRAVVEAAGRAVYERTRGGWLAGAEGESHLLRWLTATAQASESAEYALAVEATRVLMRQARYAGATLLERQLFVERCGDLILGRLQQVGADRAEVLGTRRLFARLRQALAEDAPAGV